MNFDSGEIHLYFESKLLRLKYCKYQCGLAFVHTDKHEMVGRQTKCKKNGRKELAACHCGFLLNFSVAPEACNINCFFLQKLKQTKRFYIKHLHL